MRLALPAILLAFPTVALTETPRVVTDIAPVHSLAAMVMEGVGVPDLLIAPGANVHNYALRPSDARALSRAELVIWMGPSLTPQLTSKLENLASDTPTISLLARTEGLLPVRDGDGFDADAHDHSHDHADEHKDEDHDDHADEHGGDHSDSHHADHAGHDDHADDVQYDPHAWLDPEFARVWVDVIATELVTADPENAARYQKNAAAAKARITAAEITVQAVLAPVIEAPLVVYHDAFQYFEAHFGLRVLGAISGSDAEAPSVRAIRDLALQIEQDSVACMLGEPGMPRGHAKAVFGDKAHRSVRFDPPSGGQAPGPDLYPALLEVLGAAIAECLSAPVQ